MKCNFNQIANVFDFHFMVKFVILMFSMYITWSLEHCGTKYFSPLVAKPQCIDHNLQSIFENVE